MNIANILQLSFWSRKRLPVILQVEAAECGLACLAMVAHYWGLKIDIASLRRRFAVSLKGATLKGLISMASRLNLQARPLKLDMEHVSQLKLPCVLHWDMTHFVVLQKIEQNHATVHDPAVGVRRLPLREFAQHFTGVALELTPATEFQPNVELQKFSLFSLMGRVMGLRGSLIQILILGLALQVCALLAPFYMQWLVDEAILAADRDLVTVLGVGFLLLVVIQSAIGGLRSWVTTILATNLNAQWLGNTFVHLMRLPLPYFEKRHTGDIVSRFGSIQALQRSLTTQFVEGIIDGVLVLGTLGMMLLYSPKLAACACVAVLLYTVLRFAVYRPLRNATAEQIIHAAKQQTHFMESVRGVQSIRLFGRTDERRAGWMNALTDQFNADLRIARLTVSYQTANNFLFGAERIIVIWLAVLAVLEQQFSVGMLFAFVSYKDQFSQRMASLVDKLFELRMMRLHGERIADIVLTNVEADSGMEMSPEQFSSSLDIRDVRFRYSEGEPYIIDGISLSIPEGQCIAITGASGSGKTTFIKLLLGLIDPSEGEIRVGNSKLSAIGVQNFRKSLGTVMQEDALFAGTIGDNISFFESTPDMEKIVQCAHMAAINNEISQMPMGYNTLIGDIGTGLSGGQRQRILLARALYQNPKILILDEATSHLDIWNEKAVNAAIRSLQLTRIIIAHRPETIATADRVVVINQGKIAQDVMNKRAEDKLPVAPIAA